MMPDRGRTAPTLPAQRFRVVAIPPKRHRAPTLSP